MSKFRSRPVVIEAVQWSKPGDHPAVLQQGLYGMLANTFLAHGKQGWSRVNPGDWIITEPDGSGHYPCADSVFKVKYQPLDVAIQEAAWNAANREAFPDSACPKILATMRANEGLSNQEITDD